MKSTIISWYFMFTGIKISCTLVSIMAFSSTLAFMLILSVYGFDVKRSFKSLYYGATIQDNHLANSLNDLPGDQFVQLYKKSLILLCDKNNMDELNYIGYKTLVAIAASISEYPFIHPKVFLEHFLMHGQSFVGHLLAFNNGPSLPALQNFYASYKK